MKEGPKETLIAKREAAVLLMLMGVPILVCGAAVSWGMRAGIPLSGWGSHSSVSDAEQFENFVSMFWKPGLIGCALVWLGVKLWKSRGKNA